MCWLHLCDSELLLRTYALAGARSGKRCEQQLSETGSRSQDSHPDLDPPHSPLPGLNHLHALSRLPAQLPGLTHPLSQGQSPDQLPGQLLGHTHPLAWTLFNPKWRPGLLPQGKGCRQGLNLAMPCRRAGRCQGTFLPVQPLQRLQLSGMQLFKLRRSMCSSSTAHQPLSCCRQPLRAMFHNCPKVSSPCSSQHLLEVLRCFIRWNL